MPAKSKGDDSRKCSQPLTGEKHSPYSAAKPERAVSLLQHSTSPAGSNETGWLTGTGSGRRSQSSPNLGTEPKSCSRVIMSKARSKQTAPPEMGTDTGALTHTWLPSPLPALLFSGLSSFCTPEPGEQGQLSWAGDTLGTHCLPAWDSHCHYAWVILITQGHFSFTYLSLKFYWNHFLFYWPLTLLECPWFPQG